ncbi:MAG TPA: hypothetical protein VKD08_01455 [Ignavibacteriaceae bacterium]|nr:hypothetical protein [Ignavibacteriaceae bacterium]
MKIKLYHLNRQVILKIFVLILFLLIWNSCDKPTDPNPNDLPNTTVANIPGDGDTLFALQTLYWDGEDNDGYVKGYQYRYITHRLIQGDSVVQEWKYTEQTKLTVAFLSDDDLNKQEFEVRAVDNTGAVDPSPAVKVFYTQRTYFPITTIETPSNNEKYFAQDQTSDWWEGIKLIYSARDPDEEGGIVEYAWSVDNGQWHWTQDTLIFIPPSEFSQPLTGQHVIRATSRDNTNLVDPVGDSVTITLVKPTFSRDILIIDETDESNFPFGTVHPSDQQVDQFYSEIFGTPYQWDFKTRGIPPKDTLGQYKLVVWHADDYPSSQPHKIVNHTDILEDYLDVGGKFFMSGWRILKSFAWQSSFPINFEDGTFVHDYLHIISVDETFGYTGDCTGFAGVGSSFDDIRIDSTKLVDFPFIVPGSSWGLTNINLIVQPAGFTDIIYSYSNNINSQFPQYRGKACGLRYYGSSFDAVILGFPVFFLVEDDAQLMVNQILQNLNLR